MQGCAREGKNTYINSRLSEDLVRSALPLTLERHESRASEWNKVHASALFKIPRKKLYAKINKYQLGHPAERSESDKAIYPEPA